MRGDIAPIIPLLDKCGEWKSRWHISVQLLMLSILYLKVQPQELPRGGGRRSKYSKFQGEALYTAPPLVGKNECGKVHWPARERTPCRLQVAPKQDMQVFTSIAACNSGPSGSEVSMEIKSQRSFNKASLIFSSNPIIFIHWPNGQ